MKTNKKNLNETAANNDSCVGIHDLIDYQILQYRREVDEHRVDLSKAEGRCVAWQEAEKDFSTHDRSELGEQSRVEYCGLLCPHSTGCLVALRFLNSKNTQPLHRVG